jgi:hypothetical protein
VTCIQYTGLCYDGDMNAKPLIWIGLTIGSTLGGYLPTLFGADPFSAWPILMSAVGGVLGVWAGYKLADYI